MFPKSFLFEESKHLDPNNERQISRNFISPEALSDTTEVRNENLHFTKCFKFEYSGYMNA